MLTKELLRVSRAGGGYRPQFVGEEHRGLAARVIGTYQGHVGQPRERLESALTELERDAPDFKLVRGFAKLLDREATVETRAPLPPERTRRAAFEAAEAVGVVTEADRERALARAADRLAVDPDDLEQSLYADLDDRQILTDVSTRYDPDSLCEQYDLSLAQTALFDATEVRVRSDDPKAVISAVKRLRLMYEIERTDDGREVVVTGPTTLFRRTRRYGTRFARLLRSVAKTTEWRLDATIDDDGTERELVLTEDDVTVPDHDPVTEVTFDSGVEADFAARFEALDLDWDLVREPEPLASGAHVVIPDFAFDYQYADFRVYFEIMGFWTPEYVAKKLDRLADLEDVELLVAVDQSLGVGEIDDVEQLTESGDAAAEVEARDHRAIGYSGTVRVKDVRDALRRYEDDLVAAGAADLPAQLAPEADVTTLAAVAAAHGVSEDAIEDKDFPEHERVGRTLVRPGVLESLAGEIEAGTDLAEAEELLATYGIDDASATLSWLGYRVEWEGLGGGTIVARDH
ncbi:MAG: DUF790 family protein [Halapricum sp.]